MNYNNAGPETRDDVFLLSTDEAEKYFKNNDDRRCYPTLYAKNCGAGTNTVGSGWYWLRSRGRIDETFCVFVAHDGSIDVIGEYDFRRGHYPPCHSY